MLKGYKFKYGKDEFIITYNMLADVRTETLTTLGRSGQILKVKLVLYAESATSIEMGELQPGDKDYID